MTQHFWGKFDPTKLQISSCGRFLVSIASARKRAAGASAAPDLQHSIDGEAIEVAAQVPTPPVRSTGRYSGRVERAIQSFLDARLVRGTDTPHVVNPRVERAIQLHMVSNSARLDPPAVSSRVERALRAYVKAG